MCLLWIGPEHRPEMTCISYEGPVVVEPFNARLNALPYAKRAKEVHASLSKVWAQADLRG